MGVSQLVLLGSLEITFDPRNFVSIITGSMTKEMISFTLGSDDNGQQI